MLGLISASVKAGVTPIDLLAAATKAYALESELHSQQGLFLGQLVQDAP